MSTINSRVRCPASPLPCLAASGRGCLACVPLPARARSCSSHTDGRRRWNFGRGPGRGYRRRRNAMKHESLLQPGEPFRFCTSPPLQVAGLVHLVQVGQALVHERHAVGRVPQAVRQPHRAGGRQGQGPDARDLDTGAACPCARGGSSAGQGGQGADALARWRDRGALLAVYPGHRERVGGGSSRCGLTLKKRAKATQLVHPPTLCREIETPRCLRSSNILTPAVNAAQGPQVLCGRRKVAPGGAGACEAPLAARLGFESPFLRRPLLGSWLREVDCGGLWHYAAVLPQGLHLGLLLRGGQHRSGLRLTMLRGGRR
jgi:hypothetical protein